MILGMTLDNDKPGSVAKIDEKKKAPVKKSGKVRTGT